MTVSILPRPGSGPAAFPELTRRDLQPLVELASARIGADMKDLSIQELR